LQKCRNFVYSVNKNPKTNIIMKTIFKLLSLVVMMAVVTACSSISVTYDYDKTVDFTKLKTYEFYGWSDGSDKLLNSLEKDRIEAAFAAEFKERGITRVESGGDMVVALYIMTQDKTQYNATTTGTGYGGYYGYGPGWGWGAGYGGMGMATTTVSEYNYTVGTLVIDVFHPNDQKLIWESIGTKTIDDNLQTREKNIPKNIAKIMEPYPVKPIPEPKK
jgi:hypothetical protein